MCTAVDDPFPVTFLGPLLFRGLGEFLANRIVGRIVFA